MSLILARDPECKGAGVGVELVDAFLEQYYKHYIAQGNPIALFAEFRETTSYKYVTRKLKSLEKALGLKLEVEELGTEDVGVDTMHRVAIKPIQG